MSGDSLSRSDVVTPTPDYDRACLLAVARFALSGWLVGCSLFDRGRDDGKVEVVHYLQVGVSVGYEYSVDIARGADNESVPANPLVLDGRPWPLRYSLTDYKKPTGVCRHLFLCIDLYAVAALLALAAGVCWLLRRRSRVAPAAAIVASSSDPPQHGAR